MKPSDYLKIGWCREARARAKDNRVVRPSDPDACSWCLVGVLEVLPLMMAQRFYATIREILDLKRGQPLIAWNDMLRRDQTVAKKHHEVITLALEAERRMGL